MRITRGRDCCSPSFWRIFRPAYKNGDLHRTKHRWKVARAKTVSSKPPINWRLALILTIVTFLIGVALGAAGLAADGGFPQIVLLGLSTVFLFLSFAGVYVTLVGRYYYKS